MSSRVSAVLIVLATGCGEPRTVSPPPVIASTPAPAGVAAASDAAPPSPIPEDATFAAWLTSGDWTPLIDRAVGFVGLTGDAGQPVTIRRWCLPRGATYAKFEALDLAAGVTSDARRTRCDAHDATTVDCGESGAGRWHHIFRFARRAHQWVLVGIASFGDGAVTLADQQRYDTEIASEGHCN